MQTIALDIHAHIAPVVPGLAELPGVDWQPDKPSLSFAEGGALAAPSVFRPEALLAWMDKQRVQRAWISAPPPLYRLGLDEAATAQWVGYLNPALAAVAFGHDRLAPVFHLPVQHPALATEIVGRIAAEHPDHVRFAMAAGSARHGFSISSPAFEPLWAALNQARGTVLLHPVSGIDPRLDAFFLHNLLGGPGETALAAAHLAMSGVLERYTAMRVILAHGGGSAAAVVGRLERGQSVRRPGAYVEGVRPARQAFRDLYADCITHSASMLPVVAEAFGAEHVLFGSDWPFSMGLIDPHAQMAEVEPALRARIFAAEA